MFVFHPELFHAKAKAQEVLENGGIMWFGDYSSCDVLHEEYSVEVEGMRDPETAREVLRIQRRTFPQWKLGSIWYRHYRDHYWCAALCKLWALSG